MAENSTSRLFFVDQDGPRKAGLIATRCRSCGHVSLSAVPLCPKCFARDVTVISIGQQAVLVSHSVVHHSADGFEAPYVIGLVRTNEGPTIFAPIQCDQVTALRDGEELSFSLIPREGGVGFAYSVDGQN